MQTKRSLPLPEQGAAPAVVSVAQRGGNSCRRCPAPHISAPTAANGGSRPFTGCGSRSSPTGHERGANRHKRPSCWPGSRCPQPSCSRSAQSSGSRQPVCTGRPPSCLYEQVTYCQRQQKQLLHAVNTAREPAPHPELFVTTPCFACRDI